MIPRDFFSVRHPERGEAQPSAVELEALCGRLSPQPKWWVSTECYIGHARVEIYPTSIPLSTARPAATHASNPPAISTTLWYPARCSRLHAITLRYPPLQCTATGTSFAISGSAALNLSSGCQSAPSMCPAWHSPSRRTSSTSVPPSFNTEDNCCTVICGTDSTASPAARQPSTPPSRYPATSSMPMRARRTPPPLYLLRAP